MLLFSILQLMADTMAAISMQLCAAMQVAKLTLMGSVPALAVVVIMAVVVVVAVVVVAGVSDPITRLSRYCMM